MWNFIKSIIKRVIFFVNYVPHIKTKCGILFNRHTNIKLLGPGSFNQEVVFYGLGKIIIDSGYSFGYKYGGGYNATLCEIQARTSESKIIIGKNISTNNGILICSAGKIEIGDQCLIGQDVLIMDHDAHGINPKDRRITIGNVKSIVIGNNVWIGSRVIILPGTNIGDNSIVGAGAVVKGIFPCNSIIAGNPAQIIKRL